MATEATRDEPFETHKHHCRRVGGVSDRVILKNAEKLEAKRASLGSSGSGSSSPSDDGAAGGFDDTPIPPAPPGLTLKFTIHRATDLPIADFGTLSSDPYVVLRLDAGLPQRHKQDPGMEYRTPTVHKNTNPEWNVEWIVGNVPESGFDLSCRMFDEDPADHDDRLGVANISVRDLSESWQGVENHPYKISATRLSSKRAHFLKWMGSVWSGDARSSAFLYVSIQCLGRTEGNEGARMFTIGPNVWVKHFSPLIGRLAGTKDSVQGQDGKKFVTRYKYVST